MTRAGFITLNAGCAALVLFTALMAVVAVDALTASDLGAGMAWMIAAAVVVAGAFLQARLVIRLLPFPTPAAGDGDRTGDQP